MKRFLAILLAIMLVVGMMSTASALVLRKGTKGTIVRTVQTYLNNHGWGNLVVDGVYGTKTMAAVKKFQSAFGLKADGLTGPKTFAAMGIDPGTPDPSPSYGKLKIGDEGSSVAYLQQLLQRYNYRPGYADGKFGYETYQALREFQKLNGLVVDGICGTTTWNKLLSGNVVVYGNGDDGVSFDDLENQDFYNYITSVYITPSTPAVGLPVTAEINPSQGTASFTWYRVTGTGNVKVGTGKTYTPTGNDLGCQLIVVAQGTGMTTGSSTSAPTKAVVQNGSAAVLDGYIWIKGNSEYGRTRVGDLLTAELRDSTATNNDVVWAWYVGGVEYANTRTLKITQSMIDKSVYVKAVASSTSGFMGTLISEEIPVVDYTLPIENVENPDVGDTYLKTNGVKIDFHGVTGSVAGIGVTADQCVLNPKGLALTYVWNDGVKTGTGTTFVTDAAATSLTLTVICAGHGSMTATK